MARDLLIGQPMLLELEAPIKIVGDIHGQYYDLLRLRFPTGGQPPFPTWLCWSWQTSLECACLVLADKVKYPENFIVFRGNNACASIIRIYGFYDECKRRHGTRPWNSSTDCFNCLPIAAVIDVKIFARTVVSQSVQTSHTNWIKSNVSSLLIASSTVWTITFAWSRVLDNITFVGYKM